MGRFEKLSFLQRMVLLQEVAQSGVGQSADLLWYGTGWPVCSGMWPGVLVFLETQITLQALGATWKPDALLPDPMHLALLER